MLDKQYAVRAARCRHTAANEEVYETLRRITDPLTRSWEKLAKANRIAIKFNMMMEPNHAAIVRWRYSAKMSTKDSMKIARTTCCSVTMARPALTPLNK